MDDGAAASTAADLFLRFSSVSLLPSKFTISSFIQAPSRRDCSRSKVTYSDPHFPTMRSPSFPRPRVEEEKEEEEVEEEEGRCGPPGRSSIAELRRA